MPIVFLSSDDHYYTRYLATLLIMPGFCVILLFGAPVKSELGMLWSKMDKNIFTDAVVDSVMSGVANLLQSMKC